LGIGSDDRLALQNLQIPEGSTNKNMPEWLFLSRFPTKQRLTASHLDPSSIESEKKLTKEEMYQMPTLGMH